MDLPHFDWSVGIGKTGGITENLILFREMPDGLLESITNIRNPPYNNRQRMASELSSYTRRLVSLDLSQQNFL